MQESNDEERASRSPRSSTEKSAFSQSRFEDGRNSAPKNIDEYMHGSGARRALEQDPRGDSVRCAAGATEAISYGMPAFKHNGSAVWFAAFSKHCSLFPVRP